MTDSVAADHNMDESAEQLPMLARLLNHVLTPGSSLTSSVWTAFNIIMLWLFACWLLFVFSFPDNVHVWVFGILGVGLLLTTNWFMSEIFKAGMDYDSTERKKGKKQIKEGTKATNPQPAAHRVVPPDAKKKGQSDKKQQRSK